MREFRRVLKPDGWAILLVPIDPERAETFEDPTVTTPEDRLRVFGQDDHARIYGRDYVDRLRECGFEVETTEVADLVSPDDARRMALTAAAGSVHLCR